MVTRTTSISFLYQSIDLILYFFNSYYSDGLLNSISNIGKNVKNVVVKDGSFEDLLDKNLGLFLDCKEIAGDQASREHL